MAEPDDTKKQEDLQPEKATEEKTTKEKTSAGGLLQWIIIAVAVVLCAGTGFGLGRLFAGLRTPQTPKPSQRDQPAQIETLKADATDLTGADAQKTWYYDLDPVVANLDAPGVTRYVRASLTLEVNPEVNEVKGTAFLDEKKPLLIDWLTIYLANLTLEDATGARNLKRIQSQILDAFNEKLFPDAKPQIKKILFREGFSIQ